VARSELPVYQRQAFRAPLVGEGAADGKSAGTTFFEDESVRIWHQNDDVLILSFKTKMHVIGQGVIDGMNKAVTEAEKNFKGLVIWRRMQPKAAPSRPAPTCNRCCRCSCPVASRPSSRWCTSCSRRTSA
jgi:hypothetical protein